MKTTENPPSAPPNETSERWSFLREVRWTPDGLVAAIVQEASTGEVLMMAWMDEAALRRTMESGQTHFYSRSRRKAWHKGESSGHVQQVESVCLDCDGDVILIRARQVGGACHEGYATCFFRRVGDDGALVVTSEPVFDAGRVYGPETEHGRG